MWFFNDDRDANVAPLLGDEISGEFVSDFGAPSLLTMPSDENNGSAVDFSGSNNFGTLNGGVAASPDGWGVLGQSWKFDGTTGYIDSSPWVISAYPVTLYLVCKGAFSPLIHPFSLCGSTTNTLGIRFNSTTAQAISEDAGTNIAVASGPTTMVANSWNFVACVFKNASSRICYLNGVAGTENTSTINVGLSFLTRARLGNSTSEFTTAFFSGNAAMAGISLSAPSAVQIASLYNALLYGAPQLFAQSANDRMWGKVAATGGLLLARRRAAAA